MPWSDGVINTKKLVRGSCQSKLYISRGSCHVKMAHFSRRPSSIIINRCKFYTKKTCFKKIGNFHFHYINFLKSNFVEYVKFAKRCWWNNGTGNFICLHMSWKKWNFIHNFPPTKIKLNIWILSLHRNSKKCQNKQNGATSWMLKTNNKWMQMLFWVKLL